MLNLRLNAAERDTESQGRETIVVFQVTQFFSGIEAKQR